MELVVEELQTLIDDLLGILYASTLLIEDLDVGVL